MGSYVSRQEGSRTGEEPANEMDSGGNEFGRFIGDVVTKWLVEEDEDNPQGRHRSMVVMEDFAFIEPDGKRWSAPKHAKINGASIPKALWGIIGPPFVGEYRRAAVLHDVAFSERTESTKAANEMFYYAMLADGVDRLTATIMYEAVERFGPRWDENSAATFSETPMKEEKMSEFVHIVEKAVKEVGDEDLQTVDKRVNELMS